MSLYLSLHSCDSNVSTNKHLKLRGTLFISFRNEEQTLVLDALSTQTLAPIAV